MSYRYCCDINSDDQQFWQFFWDTEYTSLQSLHLCSLKMSGKVGELDHDWRVATLTAKVSNSIQITTTQCNNFLASVFHMVVRWHKIGDAVSECTLHNSIVLAIFVPKIIKIGFNLTKLWQKQFWQFFFWDTIIGLNVW